MKKIFYAKAIYGTNEINAVKNVLKKRSLSLMNGPSVKLFERKIAKLFGKKYGLMVNSGSSANLLALSSLNLKKGSEVITPTLTFSTTLSPIYQLGLKPHFIDVDKDTFVANIDQIEKCINKKTKAILVPNLLGNVPDWLKIKKIAKKYKLKVIYDAAHAFGVKYKKNSILNYGDISILSFHATKLFHTIEGGALVTSNIKTYNKIN